MRLIKLCLLPLVGALFFSNSLRAQESSENVRFARDWIEYADSLVRQRIEIDDEITFDYDLQIINESGIPGAWVDVSNRTIYITPSLFMLFVYFADLAIVGPLNNLDLRRCYEDYRIYIAYEKEEIAEQNLRGRTAAFLPPEEFGALNNGCTGLSAYLPLPEEHRGFRNDQVVNAIGFVLLHEIGHIYHNHSVAEWPFMRGQDVTTRQAMEASMQYYCNSRQDESEADRFAVRKLVEFGWAQALVSTPLWNTLTAMNAFVVSEDRVFVFNHSTHPLPSARATESLTAAVEMLDLAGLPVAPDVRRRIELIERSQAELDEQFEEIWRDLPFDVPDLRECRS